jgi:hypothetical protein
VLDKLSVSDFVGHLEVPFPTTRPEGESVELRLIEARPLERQAGDGAEREPFSLIFLGPVHPALEQRIHALAHPTLGPLEIFLVPIGPARDRPGLRYQAIFA